MNNLTTNAIYELAKSIFSFVKRENVFNRNPISNLMQVGDKVVIRAVTFHYVGTVVALDDYDIHLEPAVWLASSNQWSTALRDGDIGEFEPYPHGCFVARAAIVDWSPWRHPAIPGFQPDGQIAGEAPNPFDKVAR